MARRKGISYQLGVILSLESSYPLDMWVILPSRKSSSLNAALLTEQENVYLGSGYHSCVIRPDKLAALAKEAKKEHQKMPLLVSNIEGNSILWMKDQHDAEWQVGGVLQYGNPPRGMVAPIRWIRINQPPQDFMVSTSHPKNIEVPSNFDKQIDELLSEIISYEVETEDVECYISIDGERDVYQVELRSDDTSHIGVETSYTQEVIEYLRSPFKTGQFPISEDDTALIWDHLTDVMYPDIEIKKDEEPRTINMSFLKPFVHRSSFYPDVFSLPDTCRNLLDMSEGEQLTLAIKENKTLAERRIFERFQIELKGLEEYSSLKRLEKVTMHIYDIALLAECRQLIDRKAGKVYPVDIELGDIDFSRMPDVSEYERLDDEIQNAILMKELDDDYDYDPELDVDKDGWGTEADLVFLNSNIKVGRRGLVTIKVRLALEAEHDNYDEFVIVENLSQHVREGNVVSNSIWEEIDHRIGHLSISRVEMDRIYEDVEEIIENRGLSLSDEEFY